MSLHPLCLLLLPSAFQSQRYLQQQRVPEWVHQVASGYGSVMVLVNGLEPLPIRLQGDCSTIGAKPAYLAGQRGLEPR